AKVVQADATVPVVYGNKPAVGAEGTNLPRPGQQSHYHPPGLQVPDQGPLLLPARLRFIIAGQESVVWAEDRVHSPLVSRLQASARDLLAAVHAANPHDSLGVGASEVVQTGVERRPLARERAAGRPVPQDADVHQGQASDRLVAQLHEAVRSEVEHAADGGG